LRPQGNGQRLSRAALGQAGELLVGEHLESQGFALLARNVRVGRLEIDLVARRGPLVVFCEVRTRTSAAFLDPIDTIDRAKQLRIRRAAEIWLLRQRLEPAEVRFDAASVLIDGARRQLEYYEDAF
jgi:putative endonuclease